MVKRIVLVLAMFGGALGAGYAHAAKGFPPILRPTGGDPVVAPCGWQVCYQEYGACEQSAVETCCGWGACGDRTCEGMLGTWCEYWLEKCLAEDCSTNPPGQTGLIQ